MNAQLQIPGGMNNSIIEFWVAVLAYFLATIDPQMQSDSKKKELNLKD